MIRDKYGYRYQSHTFCNPPRGRSGTVTSLGAGAGTGLCRVHRPLLARQVEILQEENRSLREQVRVLTEQVKTLQEQNYALLRRLNTNSGNSGIPSSKDSPWYTDNQGNAGTQTGDGGSSPATMGGTENKENDTESGTSKEKAPKDSRDDPKAPGKKTGARKGHPGARQKFVTPDEELKFFPGPCSSVAVRKLRIWSLATSISILRFLLFW